MTELATAFDRLLEEAPDLDSAVTRAADRWPTRVAWRFDPGQTLTFAEVEQRSAGFAAGLATAGVAAGDRVGLLVGNRAEFPLAWLGLARLGAAVVALNPRYGPVDMTHLLRSAGCRAVLTTADRMADLIALAADVPGLQIVLDVATVEAAPNRGTGPVDATAIANVQFTSGTTGRPKGCLLSHRYWTTLAASLVAGFPRLDDRDVMLTAQPFHYVDPMWNVVAGLLAGAELVVLDGFHPSTFWEQVRRHRVTYFYCLAAMPTLLLATPPASTDTDHRVRLVQCSAVPPARHAEIEQRWGVPWFEAFGMTETGADLRVTDADHDELVGTGCVGGPAAHREVGILDPSGEPVVPGVVGELALRGPGMMDGYDGDREATDAAFRGGWFHTGDLAHTDAAGRVYLAGRLKDMIRRAGENIAAREVEDVLALHPAVTLVAAVAVADELRGEEVKAVVVADPQVADPRELAEFCAARLAPFKVPRYWEYRDTLPLTASNRVAKPALRTAQGMVFDRVDGVWR
jgi:crotonobetaine/carnitine-CoA ligase